MKITVINYGLSNLLSVRRALEHFGAQVEVTGSAQDVLAARALVLPGVGAFEDGMRGLEALGLPGPLREKAAQRTPAPGGVTRLPRWTRPAPPSGDPTSAGGRCGPPGRPARLPARRARPLCPALRGRRQTLRAQPLPGWSPGRNATLCTRLRQSPPTPPTAWPTRYTAAGACARRPAAAMCWVPSSTLKKAGRWGLRSSRNFWRCAPNDRL